MIFLTEHNYKICELLLNIVKIRTVIKGNMTVRYLLVSASKFPLITHLLKMF